LDRLQTDLPQKGTKNAKAHQLREGGRQPVKTMASLPTTQ
jgi:hypothetical protein